MGLDYIPGMAAAISEFLVWSCTFLTTDIVELNPENKGVAVEISLNFCLEVGKNLFGICGLSFSIFNIRVGRILLQAVLLDSLTPYDIDTTFEIPFLFRVQAKE